MDTKLIILILLGTIVAIVVALIILALIKYVKMNTMEKIRADVYQLFLDVEHEYKQEENQKKFNEVIRLARSMLPAWAGMFLTDKFIRITIQFWFDNVKDLLDDGKLNSSQNAGVQK
ncbi:MAG: hypothetical protein PHX08_00975 [Lachnospiraceae bacterium]|nr:hypothetical protein [Lachnospiraceae bacterium]